MADTFNSNILPINFIKSMKYQRHELQSSLKKKMQVCKCRTETTSLMLMLIFWVTTPFGPTDSNVLEEHTVSTFSPENAGCMFNQNTGIYLQI